MIRARATSSIQARSNYLAVSDSFKATSTLYHDEDLTYPLSSNFLSSIQIIKSARTVTTSCATTHPSQMASIVLSIRARLKYRSGK